MKTLEEIKKEIHTINPDITDELLDLLYEYVSIRQEYVSIRQHENMLDFVNNYNLYRKEFKKIVYDSLSHNNS